MLFSKKTKKNHLEEFYQEKWGETGWYLQKWGEMSSYEEQL